MLPLPFTPFVLVQARSAFAHPLEGVCVYTGVATGHSRHISTVTLCAHEAVVCYASPVVGRPLDFIFFLHFTQGVSVINCRPEVEHAPPPMQMAIANDEFGLTLCSLYYIRRQEYKLFWDFLYSLYSLSNYCLIKCRLPQRQRIAKPESNGQIANEIRRGEKKSEGN